MMLHLFDSSRNCDSLSGLIANISVLYFLRRQAGIVVISLHNLHGNGVEHSDKTSYPRVFGG